MIINSVETSVYDVPTRRPQQDSIQSFNAVEYVMTKIRTRDGLEGIGWTYSISACAEAVKSLIDKAYTPLLIGEDSSSIDFIWQKMWKRTHAAGAAGITTMAMATVDIALWDLSGKRAGLPLYKLFGKQRNEILVYGSGINFDLSIQKLKEEMQGFKSKGFKAFKMKIGKDLISEDVARIQAVRDVIGEDALLMVDVNQKWTSGEVINAAKYLEDFNLTWIEEPVLADDWTGYETISHKINIPIAAGETYYTKYEFKELIRRGIVQFVQADVYRVGGITEWFKIAHIAEAWNLPMAPHAAEEINVHLLCSIPNAYILEYAPLANLNNSGAIKNPIQPLNGKVSPPEKPGHGFEIDWTLVNKWKRK